MAASSERTSYVELNTSGTPRSIPSRVYTASIGVRTEYSVVKMQSRCFDSANWPMKAKFTAPSGTTSGGHRPGVA